MLAVARALADAGRTYDEPSLGLVEAERVAPTRMQAIIAELTNRREIDQRTIVVVASPLEDNGAVPIIRACDAGVLVVPLGDTPMNEVRRTIAVVGRTSFLGAITISAA